MKKVKIILIVLGVIIALALTFFIVDYNRAMKQKTPIFCIKARVLRDGGTVEYFGLGYKVIDFNTLDGYDEIKIGTWFMQYNNFINNDKKDEIKEQEQYVALENLPKEYTLEQAIQDNCFVITHNKIYNKDVLTDFIANTEINAKDRKEDSVRIVQTTTEGDLIITDVSYKIKGNDPYYDSIPSSNYIVKIDSSRDKFSKEEDRKITTLEDFPGSFYGILEEEKENTIEVKLALYAEICYVSPVKPYEEYFICAYNKNANLEGKSSFYATVIESKANYIIVTPYENEKELKSADKIMISLGDYNDALYQVGTNVKITYNGVILESYPAQVNATKIEIKSADNFELIFHDKQPQTNEKIHAIIDKKETDKYDYNIYAYDGNVNITVDGKYYSLRDALLNNKITMNEIISKANKDIKDAIVYKDGGSIEYHYPNYTIIKMHTEDGNRDVYIGVPKLNINDI